MSPGRRDSSRGSAAAPLSALILLGLLAAAPVRAQITTLEQAPPTIETQEPFPWLVVGVTAIGGLQTYGMLEMNQALEVLNREIVAPGVSFSQFSGGASLGAGLRAIIKQRLIFEGNYEKLYGSKEIGGTAKSRIEVPANAYLFTLGWDLLKKRRVGFGVEAGAGYYDATGGQTLTETTLAGVERNLGTIKFSGTGTGFHAGGYLERALSKHIWVNFYAGYRNAKVTDLEITGLEGLVPPECSEQPDHRAGRGLPDCPGMDRATRDYFPTPFPGADVPWWAAAKARWSASWVAWVDLVCAPKTRRALHGHVARACAASGLRGAMPESRAVHRCISQVSRHAVPPLLSWKRATRRMSIRWSTVMLSVFMLPPPAPQARVKDGRSALKIPPIAPSVAGWFTSTRPTSRREKSATTRSSFAWTPTV